MQLWPLALLILSQLISRQAKSEGVSPPPAGNAITSQTYPAKGLVLKVDPGALRVIIKHDAISNYMDAMTMPFKVKSAGALTGLQDGDEITFQLHVTGTESWVDQIRKTGIGAPVSGPARDGAPQRAGQEAGAPRPDYAPAVAVNTTAANPLLFYKFTNELGQAVSLNDFRGQALGITFFYTRCPLPDYCPRLTKNFQEASQRLAAMTNAPANWHFISVTFDSEFDSPAMLRAYGESYHYDPGHWSFLTGPPDKIAALAKSCGVEYSPDAGAINHNFRTLIVDAAGHLQMVFPMTGDFSDSIVDQMLKAALAKPETTKP